MNNGCHLADAVRLGYIDGVGVAIPYQLNRRKGMIPTEIHAADTRPVRREFAICGHDAATLLRSYAKRTSKADTSAARVIGAISKGILK